MPQRLDWLRINLYPGYCSELEYDKQWIAGQSNAEYHAEVFSATHFFYDPFPMVAYLRSIDKTFTNKRLQSLD